MRSAPLGIPLNREVCMKPRREKAKPKPIINQWALTIIAEAEVIKAKDIREEEKT